MPILKTLANNHRKNLEESLRIRDLAAIESECLFIKIEEQMKPFDGYIRAPDGPL